MIWQSLRLLLLCGCCTALLACTDPPTEVTDTGTSTGGLSTGMAPPLTTGMTTAVADDTGTTTTSGTTGSGADCCSAHADAGCNDPDLAACVCEAEAFCCAFSWDEECVAAALDCGGCGAATTDPGSTTDPTTTAGGDACCDPSGVPGCAADPAVEACVCGNDPFCCSKQWDGMCADSAADCGADCQPVGGGDCCAANGSPGCDDQPVADCVCAIDPFCCSQDWDGACINIAQYGCEEDCGLPPAGGDCCSAHPGPQCDDAVVNMCVCDQDNGCCINEWDQSCVNRAQYQCGLDCGLPPAGGDCCSAHPGPQCDDAAVNMCVCDQNESCCLNEWTDACVITGVTLCANLCEGVAPVDACCFPQMGPGCPGTPALEMCVCNADPFCCSNQWDGICAGISTSVCMEDCGGVNLPPPQPPGMGDCCMANGTPGCDDGDVQNCVCAADAFCCDTDWDQICADQAINDCGGCMGGSGSGGSGGSSGGPP